MCLIYRVPVANVAMRHNNMYRYDLNVEMQKEVCCDVVVEPLLLPLDNEDAQDTQGDRLWSTFEWSFFDVRVFHPNAPSYWYRYHEIL